MSNQTYSPAELVQALHSAFGTHRARAVHAKGIVLEGSFVPDPRAATLTMAAHLQRTPSAAIVRFSDFTGVPDIPDDSGAANPRGIAIKLVLPDGTVTDVIGHSFDGFPTHTSDEFRELLMAIAAGGAALDTYLAGHPVAKHFLSTQKTPASYATIAYFGVNAFRFTAADGSARFVRYQFVPVVGEQLLTAEELATKSASYLQDELRDRVARGPIEFTMLAQIAEPGDDIADPATAWPAQRERVVLGVLTVDRLGVVEDRKLAFSPVNVPVGIEPADPMLEFRGRAYPISVAGRR